MVGEKARVFVLGKFFGGYLILAYKARAYPSEAPYGTSLYGQAPYPEFEYFLARVPMLHNLFLCLQRGQDKLECLSVDFYTQV